jgi:DNA repair protein RecO (recombination protein O)
MQPQRDLAITLRVFPYSERDRIIVAITEQHGKISALAKNSISSRRFGASIEIFSASDWLFKLKPGSELYFLHEAHLRYPFEGLRKTFETFSIASAFNEIMLQIAPQQEACPELFRLHANALFGLDKTSQVKNALHLLNAYLAKILQWSGHQPQLFHCLQCKTPASEMPPDAELSCIISNASWMCPQCKPSGTYFGTLTPPILQDFQNSLTQPIRQVSSQMQSSEAEHLKLFRFLEALLIYHLPGFEQPLKSLRCFYRVK